MRRFPVLFTFCVAAWLLAVEARPSRLQQPTFRAAVDMVDVDVSVLDRDRLPVKGLTAADFRVFDDGVERQIAAFSAVDLPAREQPSARWVADVAPDVLDNEFAREGRLITILMDRSIGIEHFRAAQAFAEGALDQLRPGDMAAVAYSTFGLPQNFTSDRTRLLNAIRQPIVGLPEGDDGAEDQCYCGTCTLETIGDIAEAMLPVRQRRKVLLVVGQSMAIFSSGTCGGVLSPLRERAIRALQAANVTVYQFDPTGLETLRPSASSSTIGGPDASRAAVMRSLTRRGNLAILPDHTGGRVVSDPARASYQAAALLRESSSYYVLGFVPGAPSNSKRFHRIEVKVNRKNVMLQARRGYYGPAAQPRRRDDRREAPGLPPALRAAVEGLWPKTEIALALTVAPLARPRLDSAAVATVVAARQLVGDVTPELLQVPAPTTVNVLVGAFDRRGEALGTARQSVTLTPRRGAVGSFEYEVVSSLELRPGRYEVRAAVEDTRLGRSGSVYTYVDVPDYRRQDVEMSGLLIEARPARVSAPAAPLTDLISFTPTARRAFARTDTVTGFVRIYQGLSRPVTPGYVVATIRDDRDVSVFTQESRIVSEQFGAGRALDYYVDLPLARLAAGEYLLSIEARVGNEAARRDGRFRVLPPQ